MAEEYGLFIGGKWAPGSGRKRIQVADPCRFEEVVGTAAVADESDVDAAVAAAQQAFSAWRALPARQRGEAMQAAAEEVRGHAADLADLVRRESGLVGRDAAGEVNGAASLFEYFAQEARRLRGGVAEADDPDRLVMIVKEPVGVVAAIAPWNNPLYLLARMLAPALAVGCTVVAKPSSATPLSTLRLAEITGRAGLPPGVFNVVTGYGHDAGEALVSHPGVAKVSLTGGLAAGKRVMALAAEHVKSVTLELGGQCPAIVCADADIQAAAEAIAFQAFRQGGQVCNRVNRVYAQNQVCDQLAAALAERVSRLVVGDSTDERADFAALAGESLVARAETHVRDATGKGARVQVGGRRLTGERFDRGHYFAPTLLSECTQDMLVMQEETFGPVLAVASFEGFEEAIARANDSIYGLSAFLFTADMSRAFQGTRALAAGTVWVNDIHLTYTQCPYGGYKQSGLGRTQGPEALEAYLETKTIYWDMSGSRRHHRAGH